MGEGDRWVGVGRERKTEMGEGREGPRAGVLLAFSRTRCSWHNSHWGSPDPEMPGGPSRPSRRCCSSIPTKSETRGVPPRRPHRHVRGSRPLHGHTTCSPPPWPSSHQLHPALGAADQPAGFLTIGDVVTGEAGGSTAEQGGSSGGWTGRSPLSLQRVAPAVGTADRPRDSQRPRAAASGAPRTTSPGLIPPTGATLGAGWPGGRPGKELPTVWWKTVE